jgi:hypothetical protein
MVDGGDWVFVEKEVAVTVFQVRNLGPGSKDPYTDSA